LLPARLAENSARVGLFFCSLLALLKTQPEWGYFFPPTKINHFKRISIMRSEPSIKRTIAFFDGQNIFHAAREAFNYQSPNYDPQKLASHYCQFYHWQL
jgi:hypothetical protein